MIEDEATKSQVQKGESKRSILRRVVFKTLHELLRNKVDRIIPTILLFLVDFFQLLSFHFPIPNQGILHESFGWFGGLTDWLAYFSNAFRVVPFLESSSGARIALFAIGLVAVAIYVVLFVICCLQSMYHAKWPIVFLKNYTCMHLLFYFSNCEIFFLGHVTFQSSPCL